MSYMSDLMINVAISDIDIAIKGFSSLNANAPMNGDESNIGKLEWTFFLCTYSRFVHLNTWFGRESIVRVENEFIPQFEIAIASLSEFLDRRKEFGFTSHQCKKLKHYRNNMKARSDNLVDNYCNGFASVFKPDDVDPTSKKKLSA